MIEFIKTFLSTRKIQKGLIKIGILGFVLYLLTLVSPENNYIIVLAFVVGVMAHIIQSKWRKK